MTAERVRQVTAEMSLTTSNCNRMLLRSLLNIIHHSHGPIFNLICFIVPYKNIYGLGISTVSKFSNRRRWGDPQGVPLYFIWCVLLSHTRIYMVKGWGFWLFTSFQTGGVGVTPRDFPFILFDLFYCPIQKYIWFRGGDLDCFQDNST